MAVSLRLRHLAWLAVPIGVLTLCLWVTLARVERVRHVSAIALEPLRAEPASATGYAGGVRQFVVPGQNYESYQWIAQAQQMLARGEWRVRKIDYENAPGGRPVNATSPYRWWLGLVAWLEHSFSVQPMGLSVESAALWADPLLHLVFIAGTTAFVAGQFGLFPAALICCGLALVFPLGANFVPGAPDDLGLAVTLAVWSVLPLLAGLYAVGRQAEAAPNASAEHRLQRWFAVGGVIGASGLWVSVAVQVPVLIGLALGALAAAWAARKSSARGGVTSPVAALPWRTWALAGAGTTLFWYLVEFAPDHLGSWQVRVVHPLHALAWLGLGELLARASEWMRTGRWCARDVLPVAGALAAIVTLVWTGAAVHSGGILAAEPSSFRLTRLAGDSAAPNFLRWLMHPGVGGKALAVTLPLLLGGLPAWWLLTRNVAPAHRALLLVALGPVLVALGFACWQLSWWTPLNALLCVLAAAALPVMAAQERRWARWVGSAMAAPCLIAGVVQYVALADAGEASSLDETELVGLVQRDLAHWLARRTGTEGAVVLAPPAETAALSYYGGLRGVGTLSWDNQEGLMATVRILSATTRQEAEALINRRHVTYVVLPSWDSYFREYARVGSGQVEGSFFDELQHMSLPPWLRPVSYPFPTIAGFEDRSVTVVEVVDEQDEATALSRIATYFVEMNRPDFAAGAAQALRRFPSNLGAWAARAEVESARGDSEGLAASLKYLLPRLKSGADRNLSVERRAGLAVVLARAKHTDLAREQIRRCLAQLDEARLRSLSPSALYRLQLLAKSYDLAIADVRLRQLSLDLLPAGQREQVLR